MNKKIKYFLIGGLGLTTLTYLVEWIFLLNCNDGLGCLAMGSIYHIPGILISKIIGQNKINILIVCSAFVYFIIGGLIGLLLASKKK